MTIQALGAALTQARLGLKVAALLRHPIVSAAGVEAQLRDRLARRNENFLFFVEHSIFAQPHSPYRPLLDLAGYDLPRLRTLVAARGLDAALDQLGRDGVYLRIQEFKGTEDVRRGNRTFRFGDSDFLNPTLRPLLTTQSSGSRSQGVQSTVSAEGLLDEARTRRWLLEQYRLAQRDVVVWRTPGVGLRNALSFSIVGRPPVRWFSPGGGLSLPSLILLRVARLASRVPVPEPRVLPAGDVLEVARYLSRANTERGMLVVTFVNPALRLVLAAEEAGIGLGDVVFLVSGEPLTPDKRRRIEARGFAILPVYAFSELGNVAQGCLAARVADDVHVMTDSLAVRQYWRPVDRQGTTVPAYLFTSLLPHARHIMLNVETGDYGELEDRRCGCFLDRAGFHLHMHTIRSFEKLTAEGLTFAGPALIALIEEVLPREFGGDSRHYQFVEEEDARGFTRLYVLASPQLGHIDEDALRRTVLREIRNRHVNLAYGLEIERIWEEAETIQILRRDPVMTTAAKILHLHRYRSPLRGADGEAGEHERSPS